MTNLGTGIGSFQTALSVILRELAPRQWRMSKQKRSAAFEDGSELISSLE